MSTPERVQLGYLALAGVLILVGQWPLGVLAFAAALCVPRGRA